MFDTSNTPISGGTVLGLVIYGTLSLFVTGPIVSERLIEKSGWLENCPEAIRAEIEAQRPQPFRLPNITCSDIFGLYGDDGREYCDYYGDYEIPIPFAGLIEKFQNVAAERHDRHVAQQAAKAGSRCSCAAVVTQERKRIDFAISAGTARLITPVSVQNLDASLAQGLRAPECSDR